MLEALAMRDSQLQKLELPETQVVQGLQLIIQVHLPEAAIESYVEVLP